MSRRRIRITLCNFWWRSLDLGSLEPWFERHDDQFPLLVNMYGITETTVHVTYRPLSLKDVKKRLGSLLVNRFLTFLYIF